MQVVCGIIQRKDRYLIAKRGRGTDQGVWEFPGGKVEQGETKEEAVIREIKEELGVDIRILSFVTSIYDDHTADGFKVFAYLCEIIQGKIQLNVHDEMKWVYANELYRYGFQPADKPILDMLNKK